MSCEKRLNLKNILNCRDLGGYPSEYGTTQFGRFLRCGVVETPTEEDIAALTRHRVRTVIDLRGDFETVNTPSLFSRIPGCEVHHVSLYEANAANANPENTTLLDIYKTITDDYRQGFKKIFEIIADAPDGAVMYHCFFGKDRTGILSMLLLSAAGVPRADIIADYQLTFTYIYEYLMSHFDTIWCKDMTMHYSDAATMAELLGYVDGKYGSPVDYLLGCGISAETLEKVRNKFFED